MANSWEDRLNASADAAETASARADAASQIIHDVANGDDLSTVTTANGPVRTLAKFIKDNQITADEFLATINAIANGDETSTVTTDNGEVPTVAKSVKDVSDAILDGVDESFLEIHTLETDTDTITLSGFTNAAVAVYVEGSREFKFTKSGSYDLVFDVPLYTGTVVHVVKRNAEYVLDISAINIANASETDQKALNLWLDDIKAHAQALTGKSDTGHGHAIADVTNLASELDSKQDNLPVLTGNAFKSLRVNTTEDGLEWAGGVTAYQEFTASGTWNKDPNAEWVYVEAIGGGGAGNSSTDTGNNGGGGGGGAFASKLFRATDLLDSLTVSVGAGGAGNSTGTPAPHGGDSVFGTLTASGGRGGEAMRGGNGGGGELGVKTTSTFAAGGYSSGGGGGDGGNGYATGGANCVMGGAGGAGWRGAGGVSTNGGNGGAGGTTEDNGTMTPTNVAAEPGMFPGGGGGGGEHGGAAGGDGVVRIWQW